MIIDIYYIYTLLVIHIYIYIYIYIYIMAIIINIDYPLSIVISHKLIHISLNRIIFCYSSVIRVT